VARRRGTQRGYDEHERWTTRENSLARRHNNGRERGGNERQARQRGRGGARWAREGVTKLLRRCSAARSCDDDEKGRSLLSCSSASLDISLTRDNNHHQHKLKHELSKTPRCRTLRSRSSSCCSCCSPTPAAASRPRAQRSTHSGARDKALKFLSHACPKPASRSLALAPCWAPPRPRRCLPPLSLSLSRAHDHHHAARDQIRVRGNRTW